MPLTWLLFCILEQYQSSQDRKKDIQKERDKWNGLFADDMILWEKTLKFSIKPCNN